MAQISFILRLVAGLAILILTYSIYHRTFDGTKSGGKFLLFGSETGASAGQLTFGFVVIGLIGAGLAILGVFGLLKSRN